MNIHSYFCTLDHYAFLLLVVKLLKEISKNFAGKPFPDGWDRLYMDKMDSPVSLTAFGIFILIEYLHKPFLNPTWFQTHCVVTASH